MGSSVLLKTFFRVWKVEKIVWKFQSEKISEKRNESHEDITGRNKTVLIYKQYNYIYYKYKKCVDIIKIYKRIQ